MGEATPVCTKKPCIEQVVRFPAAHNAPCLRGIGQVERPNATDERKSKIEIPQTSRWYVFDRFFFDQSTVPTTRALHRALIMPETFGKTTKAMSSICSFVALPEQTNGALLGGRNSLASQLFPYNIYQNDRAQCTLAKSRVDILAPPPKIRRPLPTSGLYWTSVSSKYYSLSCAIKSHTAASRSRQGFQSVCWHHTDQLYT